MDFETYKGSLAQDTPPEELSPAAIGRSLSTAASTPRRSAKRWARAWAAALT